MFLDKMKAYLVLAAVVGTVLAPMVRIYERMPPNAELLVDETTNTYISPPCLYRFHGPSGELPQAHVARLSDVKRQHYKPGLDCRDADGFIGENYSAAWIPLIRAGVVSAPTRWNADGTWKW